MSRNFILVFGAICWTGVAADVLLHLMSGDLLAPAGMAFIFVFWTVLRRHRFAAIAAKA